MPRRVVTLPPTARGDAALVFAERARRSGADLLEVRTDLHSASDLDAAGLARRVPLLIAERGAAISAGWSRHATLLDAPGATVESLHAPTPLSPGDAAGSWAHRQVAAGAQVKHVEPLGDPSSAARLFETQRLLGQRFGAERVTVLATGPLALPFRAALSERNALDYVALDGTWAAAPGQRLLADAVRSGDRAGPRLGIIGARIGGSRSPRVHPQPFDRIDLPEDADLQPLLDALLPWYRGLAVTAPFKRAVAKHLRAGDEAVNTLVRRDGRWHGENTDPAGARAAIDVLGTTDVTVLGDGGAAVAVKRVLPRVHVIRRADVSAELRGTFVWTWPAHLAPPSGLSFRAGSPVAVIAYGPPARVIASEIRARGGTPVMLGPRWFIAQARAQQELWRTAT